MLDHDLEPLIGKDDWTRANGMLNSPGAMVTSPEVPQFLTSETIGLAS
jgi:hypothetical protein